MALLIQLPQAVATKWVHQAMPVTEYLWHLLEPPRLATERPLITLDIREVVVPTVAGRTIVLLPDTLTTNGCASGLDPTRGNSAGATVAGPGPEVAAEAEAEIGRKITAALRPGTNETARDHPLDGGARETANNDVGR